MAGPTEHNGTSPTAGDTPEAAGRQPAAVELRNISKSFGENRALDHVDLRIDRGEVVALVGQNGSGKSTLVKILSGFHDPEPGGELLVSGEPVPLPLEAGKAGEIGLSFVYQNLALAGGLSVLENLNLGRRLGPGRAAWSVINWQGERRGARAVLERYGVDLDLNQLTGTLPPVDQARLAIVRAAEELRRFRERTGHQHSVLVLDEPTVFLPEGDIQFLFELVRTVVAEGAAVLFISHDLAAIREIADRIVVLRDGKKVAEQDASGVDEDTLVELIVGIRAGRHDASAADAPAVATRRAAAAGQPVEIEHLAGGRLRDLSMHIDKGEIVGVAGLIGSGAEDVPYLVFGAAPSTSGTLRLGEDRLNVPQLRPEHAVRRGVALVPADRHLYGLAADLSVWENMVMLIEDDYFRQGVFHRGELVDLAEQAIRQFAVKPPLAEVPGSSLSGGNQQKVVLAKWLLAKPRLLVLHEPTQGVDVGARQDIYRFVKAAAAQDQMAVLWVTTDSGELAEVCDRVVICSQGRATGELRGEAVNEDAINAAVLRQVEEVG